MMTRAAAAVLGTALLVAGASSATAGTFEVKGPEITKGDKEFGVNTAFFSGYPMNADLVRFSAEIGVGYGFTDWWKAGLKINLDKPVGGDLEAVTAGAEMQFLLRKGGERSLAIGWYTGVDVALRDDQTNTVTFGPIFGWSIDDKTSVAVNTFFQRTFGDNRSEGTDLAYAWQVKREVREGFGLGIEGYGLLPNIGNMPGTDFQEHRIGPMLYLERSLKRGNGGPSKVSMKDSKAGNGKDDGDGGPKFNLEAGVLFGLTDATQDRVYKIKGSFTF